MCETLICRLCLRQCVELDKDRTKLLAFIGSLICLQSVDFRDESLKFRAAPIDRVDLLSNERLQAMSGSVFGVDVSSRRGAHASLYLS